MAAQWVDKGSIRGPAGEAATITVIDTSTAPAGSEALVTNIGSETHAQLAFRIPKGDKGDPGEPGQKGDPGDPGADGADGAPATVAVGTVTTLPAGSDATVQNVGTESAAIFDFGIPKGDKGDAGSTLTGTALGMSVHIEDATPNSKIKEIRIRPYGDGSPVNLWRNPNGTLNGVTCTDNGDGTVTISGRATDYTTISIDPEPDYADFYFKPGDSCTLTIDKYINYIGSAGSYFGVIQHTSSGTDNIIIVGNTSNAISRTFAIGNDTEYVKFALYVPSGATVSGTYNITLTKNNGTDNSDIDKIVSVILNNNITIDLSDNHLQASEDAKDELVWSADGSIKLFKQVGGSSTVSLPSKDMPSFNASGSGYITINGQQSGLGALVDVDITYERDISKVIESLEANIGSGSGSDTGESSGVDYEEFNLLDEHDVECMCYKLGSFVNVFMQHESVNAYFTLEDVDFQIPEKYAPKTNQQRCGIGTIRAYSGTFYHVSADVDTSGNITIYDHIGQNLQNNGNSWKVIQLHIFYKIDS